MKDSAKQIREAYRRLNESYHPILVFHIGDSAGFFSDYNGMILAMLYCLKHHIQYTQGQILLRGAVRHFAKVRGCRIRREGGNDSLANVANVQIHMV